MTVEIEWTVKIGTAPSPTDFTDRCQGISISQRVELSRIVPHTARLTLNNDDGALTPNAGGTYASQNWFAHGVFIYASINGGTDVPVFHGVFDDFDLIDDGTSSTVTVTAVDWMTIAGRARRESTSSDVLNQTSAIVKELRFMALGVGSDNSALPQLGNFNIPDAGAIYDGGTGSPCSYSWSDQYVGDFIYNQLVPSDLCVIYPSVIQSGVNRTGYFLVAIGSTLTRTGITAHPFTFTETAGSATEIPVRAIDTGFDVDRLINDATMTIEGGTAQRAVDPYSIEDYGQRSINFSELQNSTDADALVVATNTVNRSSGVTFGPRQITLDAATFAGNPDGLETEIEYLLDVRYGIWQTATLDYTPTGASSQQTAELVLGGRTITAVPGRTSMTIEVFPAADYQSLVLDSSTLGVLDQNRLG